MQTPSYETYLSSPQNLSTFLLHYERRDASRCLYRNMVSDLQTKFSIKSDEGSGL